MVTYIGVTYSISSPLGKYLLYYVVSIPMLCGIAVILSQTKSQTIKGILAFVGGISLEVYLIHAQLMLPLTDMLTEWFCDNIHQVDIAIVMVFRFIFSFVAAIGAGYCLHVMVKRFNKRLSL